MTELPHHDIKRPDCGKLVGTAPERPKTKSRVIASVKTSAPSSKEHANSLRTGNNALILEDSTIGMDNLAVLLNHESHDRGDEVFDLILDARRFQCIRPIFDVRTDATQNRLAIADTGENVCIAFLDQDLDYVRMKLGNRHEQGRVVALILEIDIIFAVADCSSPDQFSDSTRMPFHGSIMQKRTAGNKAGGVQRCADFLHELDRPFSIPLGNHPKCRVHFLSKGFHVTGVVSVVVVVA